MTTDDPIDLELEAARKAQDAGREETLAEAKGVVAAFARLAARDPGVAGMVLDALPRRPGPPAAGPARADDPPT